LLLAEVLHEHGELGLAGAGAVLGEHGVALADGSAVGDVVEGGHSTAVDLALGAVVGAELLEELLHGVGVLLGLLADEREGTELGGQLDLLHAHLLGRGLHADVAVLLGDRVDGDGGVDGALGGGALGLAVREAHPERVWLRDSCKI